MSTPTAAMRRFTCPKCGHVVHAIARDVAHECPANRHRLTTYTPEGANDD